ncbi:tRNA 2-thiouridine(34) synthase MnmA, partial [Pseudomonas aeruginosa]
YTLGQRGGIGLGGMKGASEGAWFVLHKDVANNRLVVGQGHDHPLMQSTQLWSEAIDWVAGEQNIPAEGLRCTAKTRYRQPDQACTV